MLRKALVVVLSPLLMAQYARNYDLPYSDAAFANQVAILHPTIGKPRRITPGDPLVWSDNARDSEGAILDQAITSLPPGISVNDELTAGKEFYRVQSSKPFKACAVSSAGQPCLFDDDGNGTFDRIAENSFRSAKPLSAPAPYHKVDHIRFAAVGSGFTRQILYQGLAPDGLRLSYREFSDDMARAPFAEDIIIPLGKTFPQQFAVKGLVLTVTEIGPLGMTYTLDDADPGREWGELQRMHD